MEQALGTFGLSIGKVRGSLGAFIHQRPIDPNHGFQKDLAEAMERHICDDLQRGGILKSANRRYSTVLNEAADIALGSSYNGSRLFIEIEFRPNVEKDLVKFQIGANTGDLGVAILVLAFERNNINPSYTTMPEYPKFVRLVDQLQPNYPLLMLGFKGTLFEEEIVI